MAIEANVAWKFEERYTGGPYWIMVDPISAPLGSPRWAHAAIGSGIEVTLAVADKDGKEIPRTRVKVLGYNDMKGGTVNGVELLEDPKDWTSLGDCKVAFSRSERSRGFVDDLEALLRFNREQMEKKANGYINNIENFRKLRRVGGLWRKRRAEEEAGREILDGLDSGLLKVVLNND